MLVNLLQTMAPGCRLGWFTCNPMFAERIERAAETSTHAPSGFSQVEHPISTVCFCSTPPVACMHSLAKMGVQRLPEVAKGWAVLFIFGLKVSFLIYRVTC